MNTPTSLQLALYRAALKKFTDFSDEEWQIFSHNLYIKKYEKKGKFITGEQVCNELGFICTGSFRLFVIKDGIEITNYFCFNNELISSYRSMLKRIPGGINIEAMEDAELICLNYESLLNCMPMRR